MDELWSFVLDKDNEQWVWLAIDVVTREIVGCYIGERSGKSAKRLVGLITCRVSLLVQFATPISGLTIQLPYRVSATLAVGKETENTSYPIAIQLHLAPTSVTTRSKNLIVLEEVGKSHWSNLAVHPPLQCFSSCTLILSCLGLPIMAHVWVG